MTKTEAIAEANSNLTKCGDRVPVVCEVRKNGRRTTQYAVRFHKADELMAVVTDLNYTMIPVYVAGSVT